MRALLTLTLLIAAVTTLHAIRIYERKESVKNTLVAPKFSSEASSDELISAKDSIFFIDSFTKQHGAIEINN